MKRGIITSPIKLGLTEFMGSTGFRIDTMLDPDDIRYLIMYWDQIAIPQDNLLPGGVVPYERDLLDSGAIVRPEIEIEGSFFGNGAAEAVIYAQNMLAEILMKDKEIDWTYHHTGEDIFLPDAVSLKQNAIRVCLSGALPVPGPEVNINEILEFKQRRGDELNSLHQSLDGLYEEILKSPDQSLAEKKALQSLKLDIAALNRVANERFSMSKKVDVSLEFKATGADFLTAFLAYQGYVGHDYILTLAAATSALLSRVNISLKDTRTINAAANKNKLAYLSSAKKIDLI